jgi:threonine/homoserine/homoserine lactone efflux protein
MFDLGHVTWYVGVVVLLFLVPGPAVIITLARSMSGGVRVGIATGAGIAIGDAVHTLAAVAGLSAILTASALAYEIVRYLGAAYLIVLGVIAIRERAQSIGLPQLETISAPRAFRQAILIEVLNPKTALFFLSFLPQFTVPAKGAIWLQLLILGAIFVAMSIAYTSLLAACAATASAWLRRNSVITRWRGKIIGGIYIALGVQLALQERR